LARQHLTISSRFTVMNSDSMSIAPRLGALRLDEHRRS
jgi:hypothetical protein